MRLFDRLGAIFAFFGQDKEPTPQERRAITDAAADLATRWVRARRVEPEIMGDLIRLGGFLVAEPFEAGAVAPIDPNRVIYEKGRRDMALQLMALMGLNQSELNSLMEANDAKISD